LVAFGRRGENSHTRQGAADRSKHRTAAGTVALGLRPGRGSAPLTIERAGVPRIVPCH
jgi:hypothetical protein